jgi:hypothetical protein
MDIFENVIILHIYIKFCYKTGKIMIKMCH